MLECCKLGFIGVVCEWIGHYKVSECEFEGCCRSLFFLRMCEARFSFGRRAWSFRIEVCHFVMLCVGAVGKEDSGFDGHREDDFFDQPGFGNARGGDGGAFDKLAEARFADAEESWESRARIESNTDNDGMHDYDIVWKSLDLFLELLFVRVSNAIRCTYHAILSLFCRPLIFGEKVP